MCEMFKITKYIKMYWRKEIHLTFNWEQVVDWCKDKGKVLDHKTFLDVPALQVGNLCFSVT